MWFTRKQYSAPCNDVRPREAVAPKVEGTWTFLRDFCGASAGEGHAHDPQLGELLPPAGPDRRAKYVASSPNEIGGAYDLRVLTFRLTPDHQGLEPEPTHIGPSVNHEAPTACGSQPDVIFPVRNTATIPHVYTAERHFSQEGTLDTSRY